MICEKRIVDVRRSRSVSVCVSIQGKISLEYIPHDIPESGVIEDLIEGWIRDLADDLAVVDEEAERQVSIENGRGVGVIVSSVVVIVVFA